MRLLLPAVIAFIVWLTIGINRARGRQESSEQAFWERERRANSTRKKSIEDLPYIKIPLDELPTDALSDDEVVRECIETLNSLSGDRILNLTGYTNTDLKLMYGAPNITALTRYDQSYTTLARTLWVWGERLYKGGCTDEARSVLEFALSTGTDITGTYTTLRDIYTAAGDEEGLANLRDTAEGLNSATKPAILKELGEADGMLRL